MIQNLTNTMKEIPYAKLWENTFRWKKNCAAWMCENKNALFSVSKNVSPPPHNLTFLCPPKTSD